MRLWPTERPRIPWRVVVGLLAGVALAMTVFWSARFPYTHDGENHLVRFANYAQAVREGQWPPRFAPALMSGYGFPVFNYNYPLANIVSVPFGVLHLNPEYTFRFEVAVALLVGSASLWWGFRQSPWKDGGWFAIVFYLFAPYLQSLLLYRGNIGEIWAYGLAPFVGVWLWQAKQSARGRDWLLAAGSISLLLLSHNLFGLIGAGLWLLISFWWTPRSQWKIWGLTWLLGTGLTSWFWLPALGELSLIVLQQDSLANQVLDHGLRWEQLLFSPWHFGFSRPGPLDTLGFGRGIAVLGVWGVSLSRWVQYLLRPQADSFRRKSQFWVLSGLLVFTLFTGWMSTNGSLWLWRLFPPLNIMQFPWRWVWLMDLGMVYLAGYLYATLTGGWRRLLWLLLISQVVMALRLFPADRFHRAYQSYLTAPTTTLTRNENRPRTLTKTTFDQWWPTATVATGEGEIVTVKQWNGSRRQYEVQARTDAVVVEPTVYFPGWVVQADQTEVSIDPQWAEGLIAYHLSARDEPYQIRTHFGETTLWRQLGDTLSILSVVAWVGLWLRPYREMRKDTR